MFISYVNLSIKSEKLYVRLESASLGLSCVLFVVCYIDLLCRKSSVINFIDNVGQIVNKRLETSKAIFEIYEKTDQSVEKVTGKIALWSSSLMSGMFLIALFSAAFTFSFGDNEAIERLQLVYPMA